MSDIVILLHGAGRTARSMSRMAKVLEWQGYRVHSLGYPSRHAPIEELADYVGVQIHQMHFDQGVELHFVTHSLGGIVLRYYLGYDRPANLGRVVMLAPPNQGAELADIFGGSSLYDWILGPVGTQIGTGPDSLPNRLGPVDYPVGVIAGNRSFNPLFSFLIPGRDDGRISVARTKLAGMADFIEVPYTHPLIMNYRRVIRQCIHFIQKGKFQH